MAHSPGERLGPYEIVAPLGAGGMGEVYRATDTRLRRSVAIKVLPQNKIVDPDRRRRFLQEARAASALNHPNIVTLHDIASENGVDYLVMEYVPGQSLDKLISPKGLPLVEVTGYITQIAGALAAAHAAGIVHRDIKPANLIVTAQSQVKVLDFGLAKLMERGNVGGEDETVTRESALTEAGTVVGTVAYMSPEQASARPLDHRTDIFSLGVVLYELLAGKRPFQGKSHVDTLHAVIHDAPPALSQQPPELEEILAKALAKEPNDRYQHAGDLALDLRRLQSAWANKSLPSMRSPEITWPGRRVGWAVLATALVLGTAAGWWAGQRRTLPPLENPLTNARFTRFTDFPGDEIDAAISPDGRFVVFLSDREGPFDVWLSQVGTGRFNNLTQGRDADMRATEHTVGFSGDGSEVRYRGTGEKRRSRMRPLMGGPPRLFLGERVPSMAWSHDGSRLVYHTNEDGDPMFVADRTGADARQIFKGGHNHDQAWSQDGRWIYFVHGIGAPTDLWRIDATGGRPERLTQHNAGWATSFTNDVDFPAPIDPRTVLYVSLDQDGAGPWLWAYDVERKVTRRVSFGLEQFTSVSASADGRRLVVSVANPTASLWSVPILDRVTEERDVKSFPVPTERALTPRFGGTSLFYNGTGDGLWRYGDGQALEIWKGADGAVSEPPAVSLDGRRVAVVLRRNGILRLHVGTADGTDFHIVGETIRVVGSASWSPDGNWIVTGGDDEKGPGLFKTPVDGGLPTRLLDGIGTDPVWSPDGNLIVYASPSAASSSPLRAVRPDGTLVELPAISVKVQGERFRFTPDGRGLIYMQGGLSSQDFWLLDLATRKTRLLTRLNDSATMRTFDVTPDGKQIVFDRLRKNSDLVLIDLQRQAP